LQHDFILLDRSGSMESLWTEALGSVNSYVAKLAEDKVDTGVTLAAFDERAGKLDLQIVRDRIIPSTWHTVKPTELGPRGGTPLNDAIGEIVTRAKAGNYDKVAIIIMTDGHENASKELSVSQAKQLLEDCRSKGWQVIFLGANFDNASQSAGYGNSMRATVSMAAGAMAASTATLASKRAFYGVTGQAINFSEEEKAELNKGAGKTTP
jgi:Mg-chelatase subunit ChlD